MNLLVCVKQVPDTAEIRIDPKTNTLIRSGVPSIVNPFDSYAMEMAARLKDAVPGSRIVVLSMGPEQAKTALKQCLAVGADKAYLVSDRAFGGSDTLATSYILSRAIVRVEELEGKFDLIFCGKQAIDGAQVGPEIAEHLDYPQVTCAVGLSVEGGTAKVKRESEDDFELLGVKMPCVITVTKLPYEPRYPTIRTKLAANKVEIPTLTSADLTIDLSRAGLKGSPTKVKKTYTAPQKSGGVRIQEESGTDSGKRLFESLCETCVI